MEYDGRVAGGDPIYNTTLREPSARVTVEGSRAHQVRYTLQPQQPYPPQNRTGIAQDETRQYPVRLRQSDTLWSYRRVYTCLIYLGGPAPPVSNIPSHGG